MMSDNTFQLNRLAELAKQTVSNKKKIVAVMLLIVALMPLLLLYLSSSFDMYQTYYYLQRQFYRNVFAFFTVFAPYIFFFNHIRVKKGVPVCQHHASVVEQFLNMALFCFVLVPVSVALVYGVSHYIFAAIFPQNLYQFSIIDLKHLFFGRLFTPVLVFLMQLMFFVNLLFSQKKVLKTVIAHVVLFYLYISIVLLGDHYFMGRAVFMSPFLYILPVVMFISSYFLLKKGGFPVSINVNVAVKVK